MFEADRARFRSELVRIGHGVLGEGSLRDAHHLVARSEPAHRGADLDDAAGDIHAGHRLLGLEQSEAEETDEVRRSRHQMPHPSVQAGGDDFDHDLPLAEPRSCDLLDRERVR